MRRIGDALVRSCGRQLLRAELGADCDHGCLAIYSSPFSRTLQTAQLVCTQHQRWQHTNA